MNTLLYLMPLALFLGGMGLAAFLWALRSGQYDDLDGAAERVLIDEDIVLQSGPLGRRKGDE
ncbi:cbb3-type cytochrome oxidase assembly protein CcoS [Phyllobacterium phragmitis]|uniref:Cbb3-type cytochrome oxidase assembly protein CcoS n=1 Tax=Phyllobacterium phragmitis TaxID=2670329 RepID=A0A2S9IMV9_9HYPH|nr:cbb3-type cytochrome oxidase assembly protein CcoS [Phyllobacterium phragmitis]PRD41855.1 cbb3-type cytochrome oxidase assembly protein CcoS [Phyllobacterium phragmitis]